MIHILRLAIFLAFVGLGLAVAVGPATRRRAFTNVFLLYVLAVNAFVALRQTDAWPFSPFRMMAVDARERGVARTMIAFRAVDGHGREWEVEPLSWSPLFPQAVMGLFEVAFPRVPPEEREEVGRFLLDRAEAARSSKAAGRWIGNERVLGPLAAPDTNLSRGVGQVPPEPLVALRVYRVTWTAERLLRDPLSARRVLAFEFRSPRPR